MADNNILMYLMSRGLGDVQYGSPTASSPPWLIANNAVRGWGGNTAKAAQQLQNSALSTNDPALRSQYEQAARLLQGGGSPVQNLTPLE